MPICLYVQETKGVVREVSVDDERSMFTLVKGPPEILGTLDNIDIYITRNYIFEPLINENKLPKPYDTYIHGCMVLRSTDRTDLSLLDCKRLGLAPVHR